MDSPDSKFCMPAGRPTVIFVTSIGRRAVCPLCGMHVSVNAAGNYARHRP